MLGGDGDVTNAGRAAKCLWTRFRRGRREFGSMIDTLRLFGKKTPLSLNRTIGSQHMHHTFSNTENAIMRTSSRHPMGSKSKKKKDN